MRAAGGAGDAAGSAGLVLGTSLIPRSQNSAVGTELMEEGEQQQQCVLTPVLSFCKRPLRLTLPQAATLPIPLKNWGMQEFPVPVLWPCFEKPDSKKMVMARFARSRVTGMCSESRRS